MKRLLVALLFMCACETGLEGSTVPFEEPCREGTTYCQHSTMARCEDGEWLTFKCYNYCAPSKTHEVFSHSCDSQGENPEPVEWR